MSNYIFNVTPPNNHTRVWLYLDDERSAPSSSWVRVVNASDCIKRLSMPSIYVERLSLDHDLGLINETGYDVLLWIEEEVVTNPTFIPPREINMHTAKPAADRRREEEERKRKKRERKKGKGKEGEEEKRGEEEEKGEEEKNVNK